MSSWRLTLETWPAGESGTSVCAAESSRFADEPSNKIPQYKRLPSKSDEEEHALVLLETSADKELIGAGMTPVPPFNVLLDKVTVKEARLKCVLYVTLADRGQSVLAPVVLLVSVIFDPLAAAITGELC